MSGRYPAAEQGCTYCGNMTPAITAEGEPFCDPECLRDEYEARARAAKRGQR